MQVRKAERDFWTLNNNDLLFIDKRVHSNRIALGVCGHFTHIMTTGLMHSFIMHKTSSVFGIRIALVFRIDDQSFWVLGTAPLDGLDTCGTRYR